MRPDHDRVHLGRRRASQERSEGQALPAFLRRRASHLGAAFRQRSQCDGRSCPHGRRPGLRSGGFEPGLSREESRQVQRRLRPVARPTRDRQDFRSRPRRSHDSLHREVPRRMERRRNRLRGAGPHGGRRCGSSLPSLCTPAPARWVTAATRAGSGSLRSRTP